ncbi:MAG TPA: tetratricopeptide repeat protein [Kofleriaceae bacterium]|nr:tetratricopeptide repeat protein [Kofleriaceae bacterium]
MPEFQDYLAILTSDPTNDQAQSALEKLLPVLANRDAQSALDATRESLRERGQLELVEKLFDVEIQAVHDVARRADLLRRKGQLYVEDLLNEENAIECFRRVLELRPGDEDAQEVLAHLDLLRANWRKVVAKYLDEARGSTDRRLTTALYLSAAETTARYHRGAPEVEEFLRRALEVDPSNRRAATHLERLLRAGGKWTDLADLLQRRVESTGAADDRVHALVALSELALGPLQRHELAISCMKKVVALDPGNPRALSLLSDEFQREQNWSALVMLYTNALKARRRGAGADIEVGTLLQIAMLHWKRLGNLDAAEEFFRRIRKVDPGHQATLEFYREYLRGRGDANQLLQIYRQAQKAIAPEDGARRRHLAIAIAELSEFDLASPEKAIDAWKAILRVEPESQEARDALKRLYARTEKWNGLLDLMKDEIDRRPAADVAGRVDGLLKVVEIYERMKLDVMAINTYSAILALDPGHRGALDALSDKYKQRAQWSDLITVLSRKAELTVLPRAERAEILRDVAALWIERFGNYGQAIRPLEHLLEIVPNDRAAMVSLKDIYSRRRQWRALISLLGREAAQLDLGERSRRLTEMAQLAAERLGDSRLAIEIWNRVLELESAPTGQPPSTGAASGAPQAEPSPGQPPSSGTSHALAALAGLYERDKRYLALADVYRRQRELAQSRAESIAVLERLGALFAERLHAPAQAAETYREILRTDRAHPRAARILRELYSAAADYDELERTYGELGQWEELVDAFHAIADRTDDRAARLALLERAAGVAAQHVDSPDKLARAWERVLSIEARHAGAARALAPIYARSGKSARLLATYEILLEHAENDDARLRLLGEIRALCEDRLGSKALAFQWAARAYELRPGDAQLMTDLERLGAEADAWDEVAAILDRRVKSPDAGDAERLRLLRELGKIASQRLHDVEVAQTYWGEVLARVPDDTAALQALEEIATHRSDWPGLLEIYRRRVELETDRGKQIDLLFRAAFLEEERLADLDAAVRTYRRIVEVDVGSRRALKALSKLSEARGDWAGLADVLERELALTAESDGKVALLLRLGSLYENNLASPARALASYRGALDLQPSASIHRLIERFLGGDMPQEMRREVAQLLLPAYEQAADAERTARAIEILRGTASDAEKLEFDRRLVGLYQRLSRSDLAYQAGLRVLEREPGKNDVREELQRLAQSTGALPDLADNLELLLTDLDEKQGDVGVRRALAADLAALCQDQLADGPRAERAWRAVLAVETGAEDALAGLERIYREAGRWADLRSLCQEQLVNTLDNNRRIDLLFAIAELSEAMLADQDGAVSAYRQALEVDPSHAGAFQALERLLEGSRRWAELEELLAAEQDAVGEEGARVALLVRRARLRGDKLADRSGAIDLVEEVLARQHGNADARELLEEMMGDPAQRLRTARILEPLYAEDGLWRDLCLALRAQREAASGPAEAAELLARIAAVEEEKLSHERAAFDTWREVLALGPSDERSRQHVIRLAGRLEAWGEALSALEGALAAADAADLGARGALLRDIAGIAEQKLGDRDRASDAYRRLLEIDPSGGAETARVASQALDRLYGEAERWPQLIDIVRRQAEWAENRDERLALLTRLARLEEERGGDRRAAIADWREVLGEDADSGDALDALERLHQQEGELRELADILRRRVELASDPGNKRLHLERMARLYERDLDSAAEATSAWLEVLDFLPEDIGALDELARLYRSADRHGDLLEIVERRLATAQPAERMALVHELAELLHLHLGRDAEALEHYAEVLGSEGGVAHAAGALARVQGMLENQDLRLRAADVLLPLYEKGGDYDRLAGLLLRVADTIGDPRARLRHLRRVAEIREKFLDDRPGALTAYRDAVTAAVAEPELAELLRELERVASQEGRLGDLLDVYQQIAPDVFDGDLQRRLHLDIADLARGVRHDEALARKYYQMVLEGQPDDRRALEALEGIYREAGDNQALHDVLVRKADLAGDDIEARADALSDAAALCQHQLARPVDAIVAWEQVLELLPDSGRASEALELLYEENERWHDLTDLVERRLGFAFSVEEAVRLRFRLGQLCETHLHDPDRAVENYSAALGGDPAHDGAREALERYLDDAGTRSGAADVLEPIYVARQDWPRLVRIYEIKLEAATVPEERMQLERYIARLHEDQLEDLEGAFRWYGRLLRENPGEPGLRSQLVRLAGVLDGWSQLANLYEELLDDSPADAPVVRDIALALAELCDRRLGEVERAHAAYRRVLHNAPGDGETFARLESMLTRAQRWYALVEAYEDAVQATADAARRLDLYRRIAVVHEDRLGDLNRAVECHRAALEIDQDHGPALDELERLFQAQKQWLELAELLVGRIERAPDGSAAVPLRLRLADLLESRLSDVQGAIDQHEKVLEVEADTAALAALERLVVDEVHKQRIAGILEPIYRAKDEWRKLVVILGAQLEYADEAGRRVAMLREIADLHESRGGDLGLALDALSRAWLEDTGDDEVFDMLTALAARLEAWDQLVPTLERGIRDEYDVERVTRTLRRIADIHELRRDDAPSAIAALRRLLEAREDDPEALAALDRLLKAEGQSGELVQVVARRADLTDDPALRRVLLERVAILHEQALEKPREAIVAWRAVLAIDDADPPALDALERLHRAVGEPRELVGVLSRKIELAGSPVDARPLRFAAAKVHERELGEPFEAIALMRAVLDGDPDDPDALAALDRLYQDEELWPDLLEVIDRRAALEKAGDAARPGRFELLHRAATIVAERLLEPEQAIGRLRELLAESPRHAGARESLDAMTRDEETLLAAAAVLEELYQSEALHDRVAELAERRLAASVLDRADRSAQMAALAALHENQRGDADEAFRVWARALREAPDDEAVQGQLERLTAARGAWNDLVDLYQSMLDEAVTPEQEFLYASKLARIQEDALGDLERAAEYHGRALKAAPDSSDEQATLDALARIHELGGRWADLAETLSRQAQAWLDEAKQAEILFRLGEVRQDRLGDVEDAVHAYREVLERDPTHAPARAALERLMRDDRVRADVIATLEPLYEADRDHARLADLMMTKLPITPDTSERAAIYARLTELTENQLGDPMRALDAAGGWLAEDPSSETALAEVERLAEAVGRWSEVAARLRGIVDTVESQAVKLPLYAKLGAVQLDRERDLDAAERTFRAVLDIEPDSAAALSSLERIYRERRDRASLAEVLWRRGELAFDAAEKRGCLAEVAQLREELGDAAGAAVAWHAVLEIDDGDADALGHLAAIYEREREWAKLIQVLETSARFAGQPGDERALRARIARLWADQVGDLDQAVGAWQAAADLEAGNDEALSALEDLHTRRGDLGAVQDVLHRRLEAAGRDADRVAVMERLARLAEQRGSTDEAVHELHAILDLDGAHLRAFDELERLLGAARRWHDLVELHRRRAEAERERGDGDGEMRALIKAADVWEGPLENPEAAGEVLEVILQRKPDFVPALTRLARIYAAAGEWEKSTEVLERALALGPRGADAAELHVRLGDAARHKAEADGADGDDAALPHYAEALRHQPDHPEAVAAAEAVARRREDWPTLAELVGRRHAASRDPAARLALALELAELWKDRLGRPAEAVPLLEEAVKAAPDDARARAPLADLYVAAGRGRDAAPLYERLAEDAKKARTMKDVARYRQKLGHIYQVSGDGEHALVAYEEAFRIDPTSVATMIGLGRLYVDRREWEKARRVYRSLVLQNVDPSVGMSKAEVYYWLGVIHVELGEKDKAKGMFQRALEIEPNNPTVRQALSSL